MKTPHVFLITALSLLTASCTNELESGTELAGRLLLIPRRR